VCVCAFIDPLLHHTTSGYETCHGTIRLDCICCHES